MDTIIEDFSRLNMKASVPSDASLATSVTTLKDSDVLYYQLEFSEENYLGISQLVTSYLNLSDKTPKGVVTGSFNTQPSSFQVNDAFHITVLYTGGKVDERAEGLQSLIGKQFNVGIERIGMNQHYICIGVSIDTSLPYYGNDIKHITFGLNKFDPKKKVFPKDSFFALNPDHSNVIVLDESVVMQATFSAKTK